MGVFAEFLSSLLQWFTDLCFERGLKSAWKIKPSCWMHPWLSAGEEQMPTVFIRNGLCKWRKKTTKKWFVFPKLNPGMRSLGVSLMTSLETQRIFWVYPSLWSPKTYGSSSGRRYLFSSVSRLLWMLLNIENAVLNRITALKEPSHWLPYAPFHLTLQTISRT